MSQSQPEKLSRERVAETRRSAQPRNLAKTELRVAGGAVTEVCLRQEIATV